MNALSVSRDLYPDYNTARLSRIIKTSYRHSDSEIISPSRSEFDSLITYSCSDSDGERENEGSCTQKAAAKSSRNTSLGGRRPLRRHASKPCSSSKGDDDEDDDEDQQFDKMKSQCENSVQVAESDPVSSTRIEQSHLGSTFLEMSLVNSALSRVWDVTRNISLFGVQKAPRNTTINMNVTVNGTLEETVDISQLSLDATCVEHTLPVGNFSPATGALRNYSPITLNSTREICKENEICFTGKANPEITPVIFKQRALNSPSMKVGSSGGRTLSNYLSRTGPYDLPPASLLKRRIKSKLNQHNESRDQDGTSPKRKRWSSESDASENIPVSIGCTRIREPGRYDCSIGLQNYIYFEHDFLDMADTKCIDKSVLYKAIRNSLEVSINQPTDQEYHSVNLAWDRSEVGNISKAFCPEVYGQPVTARNCLLYLLGRLNNHTARVITDFPGFNGLKICLLTDSSKKFPIEHEDYNPEKILMPLVVEIWAFSRKAFYGLLWPFLGNRAIVYSIESMTHVRNVH